MTKCKALIFGGSAGSLEVLMKVLPDIDLQITFPIIIVIHRKQGTDSLLSELLATKTKLRVKEVEEKETVAAGTIYVSPADYHVLIENDYTFSLDYSEKINYSRPSIDVTFQAAAEIYQEGLSCILLSGSNADGVNGLITVSEYGGETVAQEPTTAQVDYMPAQAILKADVDLILKPDQMANYINSLNLKAPK